MKKRHKKEKDAHAKADATPTPVPTEPLPQDGGSGDHQPLAVADEHAADSHEGDLIIVLCFAPHDVVS
jgi:hypothetical protein